MGDHVNRWLHYAEILAAVFLGIWIHGMLSPKPVLKAETAAPEIRNPDGSVVAARAPDSAPTPPPHMIPKGHIETRRETITLKSKTGPAVPKGSPPGTAATCPDIDVTLSLSENPKTGEQRVTASSQAGYIDRFIDIPIKKYVTANDFHYASGIIVGVDTNGTQFKGAFGERDFARLRVGGAIFQESPLTGKSGVGAMGWVGLRW